MKRVSKRRAGLRALIVVLLGCTLGPGFGCHGARTEQEQSQRAAMREQEKADRRARQARRQQNFDYIREGARRREAQRAENLKATWEEAQRNARGEVAK